MLTCIQASHLGLLPIPQLRCPARSSRPTIGSQPLLSLLHICGLGQLLPPRSMRVSSHPSQTSPGPSQVLHAPAVLKKMPDGHLKVTATTECLSSRLVRFFSRYNAWFKWLTSLIATIAPLRQCAVRCESWPSTYMPLLIVFRDAITKHFSRPSSLTQRRGRRQFPQHPDTPNK